jgi:copper chaperone CopZ
MNVHLKNKNITGVRPSFREMTITVLVFKTNLQFKKDINRLSPVLSNISGILRWNVDREDIDKVLRIETRILTAQEIIRLVNNAGYICEELPD